MAELGRRLSPYSYCYNNPVIFIDPDGMWPDFMSGSPEKERREDFFSNNRGGLPDKMPDQDVFDYFTNLSNDENDRLREQSGLPQDITQGDKSQKDKNGKKDKEQEQKGGKQHFTISEEDQEFLNQMIINSFGGGLIIKAGKTVLGATKAAKSGLKLWPAAHGGRTVINGIEYTIHALERMQPVGTIMKGSASFSRGIPPSVVENAIKFGKVKPGNTSAEVIRTFENVRVVTNPEGTRVISVIKIGN